MLGIETMKRKTITREMFITCINANLKAEAEHYGPKVDWVGTFQYNLMYDDYTASRVLMTLFNDYRGFKETVTEAGATYAQYY